MNMLIAGQVDPSRLKPGDVTLEDVAWGLSMTCRYAGQVRRFWSVTDHLLLCHDMAAGLPATWAQTKEFQLHVLLHDAHEAYVQDVIKCNQRFFGGLDALKERCDWAIYRKLGLTLPTADERALVKALDKAAFETETRQLTNIPSGDGRDWELPTRTFEASREGWLMRIRALLGPAKAPRELEPYRRRT